MELTLSNVFLALVVLTLNVLDSVTTHLSFKQYPDKQLRGEGNPLMRSLMIKSKVWAEVVKQGVVLLIVSGCWLSRNPEKLNGVGTLQYLSTFLGLVVLNNSLTLVSSAIMKRKVPSPLSKLCGLLHVPKSYLFISAVAILTGLAFTIQWLIRG